MKTLFRWLFRTLIFTVLFVTLLVVSIALLKIPIDLTRFKGPVETLAGKALNRPVNIDQSIVVSTSLKPVFTLRGLRIGNPDGFAQESFINLDLAQIQVELWPLLQKKVYISEVSVQKLQITLVEKKSGAVNWIMTADKVPDEKDLAAKEASWTDAIADSVNRSVDWIGDQTENWTKDWNLDWIGNWTENWDLDWDVDWTVDTIVIKELNFQDIDLQYYHPDRPEPSRYHIEKCLGSMLPGKPLELDISGNLRSSPYSLKINIASLDEFLTEKRSWMDIQAKIAGAKLMFNGDINLANAHRSLALKGSVSGKNLNTLNELLQLDLPPLGSYNVEADLLVKDNHLEMKNLAVKTGSSSLKGTAQIIKGKEKIEAVIEFSSPLIQINDFLFDDWSWSKTEESSPADKDGNVLDATETAINKNDASGDENRNILDPDVLDNFNIALNIHSEKVLLGDEELGSGTLKATVNDGRIAIEPLELNIPGGSVKLSASLKPGTEKSDASFRAVMNNFDIGILARKNKPESKMGGLVNLDVDLQSSAASFDQIWANSNGYFDFSGQLKNLTAGIIDLWAVNLIAAIVSSTDENQSNINCAVGRWQVNDGTLTPDVFFIDTGKIRICGSGQVDFSTKRINLTISPTPKKPEFFSLATPLRVRGSFSDIQFGVKKGGMAGTAVKFITSPLHVPLRRAISEKIPGDGSDACAVVLGPDNRTGLSIKGCN